MSNIFSKVHKRISTDSTHPFIVILLGAVYSFAIALVLIAIAAILTALGVLPTSHIAQVNAASLLCGTTLGNSIAIKKAKERKLLMALGGSVLLLALIFVVGRAISGELGGFSFSAIPASLGGGLLSGIISTRSNKRKR